MCVKKENKTTFSQNLKSNRIKNNLTQQQLANMLNINRATYSYYELGKTEPSIQTIKKVCEILNVKLEDLW